MEKARDKEQIEGLIQYLISYFMFFKPAIIIVVGTLEFMLVIIINLFQKN